MSGAKGAKKQMWNVRWMKYEKQSDNIFHSWRMVGDKLVSFCDVYEVPHSNSDYSMFEGLYSKPPKEVLCSFCFTSPHWDDIEERRIAKRY